MRAIMYRNGADKKGGGLYKSEKQSHSIYGQPPERTEDQYYSIHTQAYKKKSVFSGNILFPL